MRLRDVWSSLIRRWYVALGGLAVTAVLVLVALQVVHPAWESKGSVVLLPPKSTVEPGGNPYLQLGGLAPTLDLVVASMNDQSTLEQVRELSPTAEYTVKADTTSSGPVLVITAHDRSPASSLAVRDLLLRTAPEELQSLQASLSIATRSQITSMNLTVDSEAKIVGKDQIRAVVVALGVGLFGTAFAVASLDAFLIRRRERRDPAVRRIDVREFGPVLGEYGQVASVNPEPAEISGIEVAAMPDDNSPEINLDTDAEDESIDEDSGWAWGEQETMEDSAFEGELQPGSR